MKKFFSIILVALFFIPSLLAVDVTVDSNLMDAIIKSLQEKGYTLLKQQDVGRFINESISQKAAVEEIRAALPSSLSVQDLLKAIEDAGYVVIDQETYQEEKARTEALGNEIEQIKSSLDAPVPVVLDSVDPVIPPPEVAYDLYFRSIKNRDKDFSVGGGFSLGLTSDVFKFELYALADYFLSPLGGTGGAATLEFMVESGATFGWEMLKAWKTYTYLSVDIGYFMQFASIAQAPDKIFMGYNGFMLRPRITTEIHFTEYYNIGIGFFYQTPLFPVYKEYSGFGVMFSVI